MSRLSDFKPRWQRIYRDHDQTPDRGGFPTNFYRLTFICPVCGPPMSVMIEIGPEVDVFAQRWKADPLPGAPDWPDRVSITPSIGNETRGHGVRRAPCTFHGTITNGEILP